MEKGSYKTKKINFAEFETSRFTPCLFDSSIFGHIQCGPVALSTLTHIHPSKISKLNHYRNHTSDRFMLKFLRERGFKIAKLTQCSLSNARGSIIEEKIKPYHVLLMSLLVKKNECSWFILGPNYTLYHGFQITPVKALDFLNMNTQTCYILQHKMWK